MSDERDDYERAISLAERSLSTACQPHFYETTMAQYKLARELKAQQPLVQEVIRVSKSLGELHDAGAPEGLKMALVLELHVAVRVLADWKPT